MTIHIIELLKQSQHPPLLREFGDGSKFLRNFRLIHIKIKSEIHN